MARINLYAEELGPDPRIEIIEKETPDGKFTGLRIYLELPVTRTVCLRCGFCKEEIPIALHALDYCNGTGDQGSQHDWKTFQFSGPFMHHPGDDDSSAVTFWGKSRLREVLKKALALLDAHYEKRGKP
jgi:hypothetical protein